MRQVFHLKITVVSATDLEQSATENSLGSQSSASFNRELKTFCLVCRSVFSFIGRSSFL
jgi:hypothetical protein